MNDALSTSRKELPARLRAAMQSGWADNPGWQDVVRLLAEAATEIVDLRSTLDTSRLCTQERDRRVQELESQLSATRSESVTVNAAPQRGTERLSPAGHAAGQDTEARLAAVAAPDEFVLRLKEAYFLHDLESFNSLCAQLRGLRSAEGSITPENIEFARRALKQENLGLRDFEVDRLCDAALRSLRSARGPTWLQVFEVIGKIWHRPEHNNAEAQRALKAVQDALVIQQVNPTDSRGQAAMIRADELMRYIMGSCTENECRLCRTPPEMRKWHLDYRHAGIPSYPYPQPSDIEVGS